MRSRGWAGALAHLTLFLPVRRQKLGSRGITIIFASGDSGTGCSFCYRFDPSFPATSPSLTCVGATEFMASGGPVTPGMQEQAVSEFGSGGGFSWTFDRPACKRALVSPLRCLLTALAQTKTRR